MCRGDLSSAGAVCGGGQLLGTASCWPGLQAAAPHAAFSPASLAGWPAFVKHMVSLFSSSWGKLWIVDVAKTALLGAS